MLLNFCPFCKKFLCPSLLLATAFPARWCFRSLRKQKKLCRKGCKTTNVFSRYFVQVCYLITPVNVIWAKSVEKPPGVLQLFLQSFVCIRKLQKHHVAGNAAASNKMSQLTCLQRGAQFQRRIRDQSIQLDPLVQEISLFQLVAGSGISSKMVFMQPSTAKKTLQKELQNNKCFFTLFCPSLSSYNTCKCNLGQLGRKTTWCFATLFCKNWFCIWRLRKHHVAGNAVASNRLRQWHSLQQEGPNPNTTSWNKLLKNLPIQKRRPAHSKVVSPFTGRYRQVAATMKVLCREILISTMQYGANRKVGGWTDEWLERTSKRRKNDGLIARTAKLMENWGEHENTLLNMPNTFWHTRHLLLHMPKFCARTNSTRNEKWPMEIAERGFDPRTFGLCAQHANHCATPLYHIILQAKFQ